MGIFITHLINVVTKGCVKTHLESSSEAAKFDQASTRKYWKVYKKL